MILLDTHAVIWLAQDHHRAKPLRDYARLHISPATILELHLLVEAGRLRPAAGRAVQSIAEDLRWRLDEPPSGRWFVEACELAWTRDPFDRLLVAHARLRRWKLATADDLLLAHLPPSQVLAL